MSTPPAAAAAATVPAAGAGMPGEPGPRIDFGHGRHAGALLPLFSCTSTRSWGIGEIGDLPVVARWLRAAGLDLIQMLPVNEMAVGQNSPYSALSAMAIDPLFVSLPDVPEFQALGGEGTLSPSTRARLDAVRRARGVAYGEVRALKDDALRASFARFRETDGARGASDRVSAGGAADGGATRADAFERFRAEADWWLADYALFRALHQRHAHHAWWTWAPGLRARDDDALERARGELADDIRYYEFVQWLAAEQWRAARAASAPVGFFGDLPFTVGADSADVWAHRDVFARDLSVGTPPDAFSATGQDWGLPAYRWDFMAAADFRWLRERARRARELYDGFRIDHVIGFYRTYVRPIPLPDAPPVGSRSAADPSVTALAGAAPPAAGRPVAESPVAESSVADAGDVGTSAAVPSRPPYFTPAEEHEQRALGEHVLGLFCESGACLIAEDLGTVPDFVRESLARLQVPGYRVLRWERDWHHPEKPFHNPAHYPARSLATTGTHDTDPLAIWWDTAPPDERHAVAALCGLPPEVAVPNVAAPEPDAPDGRAYPTFDDRIRDAVLRLLYASGSDLLVLPIQDLFGWRDRINTPATIGDTNWTWRLPWPVDTLPDQPAAHTRAEALRAWAAETHRSNGLTP